MGKFKVRVSLPRGEFNQDKCSILLHATQFYAKKILGTKKNIIDNYCKEIQSLIND